MVFMYFLHIIQVTLQRKQIASLFSADHELFSWAIVNAFDMKPHKLVKLIEEAQKMEQTE